MKEFNIGDVVRLKSGGPSMTVNDFSKTWKPDRNTSDITAGEFVEDKDNVNCVWFYEGDVKRHTFKSDLLNEYKII